MEQRDSQLTAAQQRIAELQAQMLHHFQQRQLARLASGNDAPPKPTALPRRKRSAQPGHPGIIASRSPWTSVPRRRLGARSLREVPVAIGGVGASA